MRQQSDWAEEYLGPTIAFKIVEGILRKPSLTLIDLARSIPTLLSQRIAMARRFVNEIDSAL